LTTIVALAMGVVAAAPLRAEGPGSAASGAAPAQARAAPATAAAAAPAAASAAPAAGVPTAAATAPTATAEPAAAGGGAPTAVKDGAAQASGLNALWSGLRALPELARGSTAGSSSATKATVDNPYGIDALWRGSDVVTKGALVILLLMSAGSWYVMFTKLFEQFKLGRQARAANKTFWDAGALPLAIETLHHKSAFRSSAVSNMYKAACRTASRCLPPSAQPPPSSACSAPYGASTMR
jgi:biopolymer transport protein ExbB